MLGNLAVANQLVRYEQTDAKHNQRAGLMRCSQGYGDVQQQGRNPQRHLQQADDE